MDCTKSSFGMGEMKPSLAFAVGYADFSIDKAIIRLCKVAPLLAELADEDGLIRLITDTITELNAAADILEKASALVFHGKPEGDVE